jgi:hypothetical protein
MAVISLKTKCTICKKDFHFVYTNKTISVDQLAAVKVWVGFALKHDICEQCTNTTKTISITLLDDVEQQKEKEVRISFKCQECGYSWSERWLYRSLLELRNIYQRLKRESKCIHTSCKKDIKLKVTSTVEQSANILID